MKFYIATTLSNAPKAIEVRDRLVELGHTITVDWMFLPAVHPKDPRVLPGMITISASEEELVRRAALDLKGVWEADITIAILPIGKGGSVELGAAITFADLSRLGEECEYRVVLWAPGGLGVYDLGESYPCVFWRHPLIERVTGNINELLDVVTSGSSPS